MLSSWRMYEMHLALFLKAGCDTAIPQVGGDDSPIQRASDSGALVRASGSVPGASRRRHFQGRQASGTPRRASSDGDARGARFERHHGRREVRAAMIARDIL
jgi:hypothetical protein